MFPKRAPVKKFPDSIEKDDVLGGLFHNRGMAQRNVERIRTILKQAEADNVQLTPARVKVYQRSVQHSYNDFTRLHQKIIALSSSVQREEQEEYRFKFLDLYEEVCIILESWVDKVAIPNVQPSSTMNQQPVIIQSPSPRALPTFDGRQLERVSTGDTAGQIEAKTITDDNYIRACKQPNERSTINRDLPLNDENRMPCKSTSMEEVLPLSNEIIDFPKERVSVQKRCQSSSESIQPKHRPPLKPDPSKSPLSKMSIATSEASQYQRCDFCAECHPTFKCPMFKQLTVSQRIVQVEVKNCCCNCLKPSHRVNACSSHACPKCNQGQRLSLHREEMIQPPESSSDMNHPEHQLSQLPDQAPVSTTPSPVPACAPGQASIPVPACTPGRAPIQLPQCQPTSDDASTSAAHSRVPVRATNQVFPLTDAVNALDQTLQPHPCRDLFDCGSQVSIPLTGIGSAKSTVSQSCTTQVRSRSNTDKLSLPCLVLPKPTELFPSSTVVDSWNISSGFHLRYMKLSDKFPLLRDSHFGWLVGETYRESPDSGSDLQSLPVCMNPVDNLCKYQESEYAAAKRVLTTIVEKCDQHSLSTHPRVEPVCCIDHLPLKDSVDQLSEFQSLANDSPGLRVCEMYPLSDCLISRSEIDMCWNTPNSFHAAFCEVENTDFQISKNPVVHVRAAKTCKEFPILSKFKMSNSCKKKRSKVPDHRKVMHKILGFNQELSLQIEKVEMCRRPS